MGSVRGIFGPGSSVLGSGRVQDFPTFHDNMVSRLVVFARLMSLLKSGDYCVRGIDLGVFGSFLDAI